MRCSNENIRSGRSSVFGPESHPDFDFGQHGAQPFAQRGTVYSTQPNRLKKFAGSLVGNGIHRYWQRLRNVLIGG
jgi:hypothetical protein